MSDLDELPRFDILVPQGATYRRRFRVYNEITDDTTGDVTREPQDLTGYSVQSQARLMKALTAPLSLDLDVNIPVVTGNNAIDFAVHPVDSDNLSGTKYFYDIELTSPSGDVERFIQGTLTIDKAVTL